MLSCCVFASQNLRRSIFRSSRRAASIPSQSRDEKPVTANPLIPADYKCPLPQLLSSHILTNARGVWGSTLPFLKFYLNSGPTYRALCSFLRKKSPRFSPFVFKSFRTLPSSVSRKSFACLPAVAGHSYANFASRTVLRDENCRVCTNNSHSGSPRALAAKGTPCRLQYRIRAISETGLIPSFRTVVCPPQ